MDFLKFEIKNWLRAPMPWIFMGILGLLSFGATVSDDVTIGGGYGNVWKNAPFVAQSYYAVFSIMCILLVTAFMNSAALRDFENNTHQIVFSSPISKAGYYFGHFFGAVVVALIPLFGISLGVWMGAALAPAFGWMDAERFGPFEVAGHLNGILVFAIPNTILVGGIVYAVAANTRSVVYPFVAALGLLVAYIASGTFLRNIENEQMAALLDPLAARTQSLLTKYWTPDDRNHQSLTLSGTILLNRLIWVAVGLVVLFLGYLKFDFSEKSKPKKTSSRFKTSTTLGTSTTLDETPAHAFEKLADFPHIEPSPNRWQQFRSQFKTDFWGVAKSIPFSLILLVGVVNMMPNLFSDNERYGGKLLPLTYNLVEMVRGSFYLFLIAVILYFCGVLVWKERNAKVSEIYDALPTRNWTVVLGKFTALASLVFIIQCVCIAICVLAQVSQGYSRHEFGVFATELLGYDFLGFLMVMALAMLVHVLSPNMYLGFFITTVIILGNSFAWVLADVESKLMVLFGTPSYTYSDMFRYAPYSKSVNWFNFYWLLFSGLLLVGAVCFFPRGKDLAWQKRFAIAGGEWKNYRFVGLGIFAIWLGVLGFLFYNTKVLNKILTSKTIEKRQVEFEKTYKKYKGIAQPRVFDVKYDIKIFPEKRRLEAEGKFWMRNISGKTIDSLHLSKPPYGRQNLKNERMSLIHEDTTLNYFIYKLQPALAVGDSMLLEFSTVFEPKGIENAVEFVEVNQNGTFFNHRAVAPVIGYDEGFELTDRNTRKEHGLPEKSRAPLLNELDTFARRNSYISNHADWVNVETTISTSADQIAIAPGSLRKEWSEGGRRFFQYKLDHVGLNFYSFMSAKYEVARRKWQPAGGGEAIDLEVYYDPKHSVNVERMLNSMQKSLEYYTTNFGPYFHKQCRIIEFPRTASFAQAFPGTMPYSEAIGFVMDFADGDKVDQVFYVVAHEMGHQWWAHQECGAEMQGGEMLVETFAQYSAMMVMEKEYGRDKMRKFLSYELDRYLSGRGTERLKELPLGRCENQGYIHYQKGSAVMYYLKEMIGEAQVNLALRRFLEKFRYAQPPYPVSTDVVREFEAATPDSLKYIIKDLFWDITLFDNKCRETTVEPLPDGKFKVTIQTESQKLKADETGKETAVPINDFIEIGAFAKAGDDEMFGKTLHRQRVRISQEKNTFSFVVDEKPWQAGIDPFSLLVDRNPKDNLAKPK